MAQAFLSKHKTDSKYLLLHTWSSFDVIVASAVMMAIHKICVCVKCQRSVENINFVVSIRRFSGVWVSNFDSDTVVRIQMPVYQFDTVMWSVATKKKNNIHELLKSIFFFGIFFSFSSFSLFILEPLLLLLSYIAFANIFLVFRIIFFFIWFSM